MVPVPSARSWAVGAMPIRFRLSSVPEPMYTRAPLDAVIVPLTVVPLVPLPVDRPRMLTWAKFDALIVLPVSRTTRPVFVFWPMLSVPPATLKVLTSFAAVVFTAYDMFTVPPFIILRTLVLPLNAPITP